MPSDETLMPPGIAKRLVQAQRAARAVSKTSSNKHHGYAYASAESIIEEARGALAEAGLACLPRGWHIEAGDPVHVVLTYLLVSEDGESWESAPVSTAVLPEKGRPADKAEATALSYNLGYYLRGLLLLPRVTEGADADARDDRGATDPAKVEADVRAVLADVQRGDAAAVSRAKAYASDMRAAGLLTSTQEVALRVAFEAAKVRLSGSTNGTKVA